MNTHGRGAWGKGQEASNFPSPFAPNSSLLRLSVFICVHLWLISLLFAAGTRAENHEFSLDASNVDPKPRTVHLAGDFNGWSKVATQMSDSGNGVFKVSIPLAEGVHY